MKWYERSLRFCEGCSGSESGERWEETREVGRTNLVKGLDVLDVEVDEEGGRSRLGCHGCLQSEVGADRR